MFGRLTPILPAPGKMSTVRLQANWPLRRPHVILTICEEQNVQNNNTPLAAKTTHVV